MSHPGREHLRRIRPLLPLVRPAELIGPVLDPKIGPPFWRMGALRILAAVQKADDGSEWYHVSYSYKDHTPSHGDTCIVRGAMFQPGALVVAIFPPASEYVNDMPYCLHLWQRLGGERLVPDLRVPAPWGATI